MIAFDPNHHDFSLDRDTERMTRAAAGDREAFNDLVRDNFESTVRIVSSMMGSHGDAEDIAQDVFLRLYRSRHRYLPTARFSTFLGTIIRNTVLNAKRSLSRNRLRSTEFVDQWLGDDGAGSAAAAPEVQWDPAENLDQQEAVLVINEAIGLLPRRQQMAIELVHFRGLSYLKAAEAMDTSRKAVKSLLGRGRKKLGETLRRQHGRRFEL